MRAEFACRNGRWCRQQAGRQASFMGQHSGLIRGASVHNRCWARLWTRFAQGGKAIHDACAGGTGE